MADINFFEVLYIRTIPQNIVVNLFKCKHDLFIYFFFFFWLSYFFEYFLKLPVTQNLYVLMCVSDHPLESKNNVVWKLIFYRFLFLNS